MKILVIVALVVVAVLTFCCWPATILGVDGDALAHSVGGGLTECKEHEHGHWRCLVIDTRTSGGVEYVVEAHSFGCWDATREGPGPDGRFPKEISGCINLIDVVSPF